MFIVYKFNRLIHENISNILHYNIQRRRIKFGAPKAHKRRKRSLNTEIKLL